MNFQDFVEIVARLRGPDGCAWDRAQTRETLQPFLVEEFYELIDAMEEKDSAGMREELGDLLFQIVLQSQLSKEEGIFTINDVIAGIADKMVRRHPHVFGNHTLDTPEDVEVWWEQNKKKEKKQASLLDGVPRTMPALLRAYEIQNRAAKAGFDFERLEQVLDKLQEETEEFKAAVKEGDSRAVDEEFGDMLFVMARAAHFANINPEDSLNRAVKKFGDRFKYMERRAEAAGRTLQEMKIEEMELLWNEAKGSL
ncbi:MAG: nucleoside triphosphate pyrophosphohydrolase [Nitrospira sp.]|nr:nucleoside triphosphate pyrophosphohydrolase [bacterium]MBL7050222.1 nucleoside triphosphate pyrophosphohydrolase [Nitrospira sp.]